MYNKKIYLVILSIINILSFEINAQNPDSDMDKVYLKNGTIIKGYIVDEKDEKTLSIKHLTPEGNDSVYVYNKKDVIMITKRQPSPQKNFIEGSNTAPVETNRNPSAQTGTVHQNADYDMTKPLRQTIKDSRIEQPMQRQMPITIENNTNEFTQGAKKGNVDDTFDPYSPFVPLTHRRYWTRDIRGFRGFTDQMIVLGIGNAANTRYAFAQSLGIQFNPIFYIGLGMEYNISLNKKESSRPVFINPRINFLDQNTTPFLDVRGGWSFFEGKGFFGSVAGGVSFAKGSSAWNVGLGYSYQRARYIYRPDKNNTKTVTAFDKYHGLFLRLTFEFNIYRF